MRNGRAENRSLRGVLSALALSATLLLVPSLASADWSAPQNVSGPGGDVDQTTIAGAADGTSWVVWKRDLCCLDVIQGTRVQTDGTQGPVVNFSDPARDSTDPVVASRADGSAMVAWLDITGANDVVMSRSIAADGTLGPIVARSTPVPGAKDISVALGDDGSAALTWLRDNGSLWVVEAVKVASDGSSGTIHPMSAPVSSADAPAISAVPAANPGSPPSFRAVWPQGSGDTSNVYTRAIAADDTLDGITVLLWPLIPSTETDPVGPGVGGDPRDVHIAAGAGGSLTIAWVRYRTDYIVNGQDDATSKNPFLVPPAFDPPLYNPDDPDDTPYYNWAIETVQATDITQFNNVQAQRIIPVTPTVAGTPYNVGGFDMSVPYGGRPVLAWVHELNGGGQRIETGRFRNNGAFANWASATGQVPSVDDPVVESNASAAAVTGWTVPGLLPGQNEVGWTRFSNSSFEPFTPSGDFLYSEDPGFVVADSGVSVAAFTGVDGADTGSSRVQIFKEPAIQVDPATVNFGKVDIGERNTRFIAIRSAGETPVDVTGISLTGPDVGRYQMIGANECVDQVMTGANCGFEVRFTPGSTANQTAKITVTSEVGTNEVNLTGSGLNRTRNRVTVNRRNVSARKGKVVRLRVRASNVGGVASNNTRVCVNLRKRALKLAGNRCRRLGALPAGASRNLNYRIRVTWRARRGVKLPVTFVMRANNAVVRQAVAQVRRRGR